MNFDDNCSTLANLAREISQLMAKRELLEHMKLASKANFDWRFSEAQMIKNNQALNKLALERYTLYVPG